MPCYDGGPSYAEREAEEANKKLSKRDAMLCAVMRAVEARGPNEIDKLLGEVNWREAGVDPADVLRWWADHKAEDERRKKVAADAKARQKLLSSLTAEQRRLLGL